MFHNFTKIRIKYRYDKYQTHIQMFYSAFKEFINLQNILNMDDNLGKGCGFEEFYHNNLKARVG